eukprot:scaffold1148_cov108-Isochrysis_galbana.AAC.15
MARSCFVRASCASASARSANRLRNNHEVDFCLGGSLCRSGEEDADGLGCSRVAGVRGNTKGSSNALSELMRINSLRITLHSPMCVRGVFSSEPTHAAEGAVLGGESSFAGGEGAVDDVFEVGVYVPWREKGGGGAFAREAFGGVEAVGV